MFSGRRNKQVLISIVLAWLVLSPFAVSLATIGPSTSTRGNMFTVAAPSIDSPPDLSFENGSLGESITWNATVDEPKNYTVTRNEDSYLSGAWDGSEIVVDLDHLYEENLTHTLPVNFTFICTFFDMQNESSSDTVIVNVIADVLAPVIVAPGNFTYEVGSFGHDIQWNITETNPDTYNITRQSNEPTGNHTVLEAGAWDGDNITINVDGLNASRWYIFTLFVNDTLGYNSTSTVNVTVYEDLTEPTTTSPDDIEYEFGSKDHFITWFAYDSNPKNYTVIVTINYNDTIYGDPEKTHGVGNITQLNWSFDDPDGGDIKVNVTGFYLGNYTFTLTLFDEFDYNITDTVNITVYEDIRAPIINFTDAFTYEEGYTDYTLNWTSEESNPLSYNLTRNGEVLMNGTWFGENFTISIDRLDVGTHIYNMTLMDYFNQSSIALTTVEVTPDAHFPIINEVRVIESYTTPTTNNLTIQAYVWDLNNITTITIEWYTTTESESESLDMDLQYGDFFLARLGEFVHGVVVHYQLTAVDNSSVSNTQLTEWVEYTISAQHAEGTPGLLWGGLLLMGSLSMLAILFIYFRTKTK